jgi:hypothetical protein
MLQRYASLLIATALVAMVATACIIRTRRPPPQGQPVYAEKHKPQKHQKQKKQKKHKGGHGHD